MPEFIDFSYPIFDRSNTSEVAMDKAIAACRNVTDVAILRWLFEKYDLSNATEVAVNKALDGAKTVNTNSLQCITRSFEAYNRSSISEAAMNRALAA